MVNMHITHANIIQSSCNLADVTHKYVFILFALYMQIFWTNIRFTQLFILQMPEVLSSCSGYRFCIMNTHTMTFAMFMCMHFALVKQITYFSYYFLKN